MEGGSSNSACAYKKRLWTVEEDRILLDYIKIHGNGKWNRVAKLTGLKICRKSCRLRWMNYLSPNIKRSNFSEEEDDLLIRLHKLLGNSNHQAYGFLQPKFKNYWNTHLSRRLGVKKGNYNVTTSFTTFSGELLMNNPDYPSTSNCISNPNNNNNGGTGRNAAEDRSKDLVELTIKSRSENGGLG